MYATPYTITKITRDGRRMYTAHPSTRHLLDERDVFTVTAQMSKTFQAAVPSTPIPSTPVPRKIPTPQISFTAGAGGGITRRTIWSTTQDSQLTLTVALFADRPGKKKNTTVPAQLPNNPPPTESAEETAAQIWQLATAGR